MGCHLATHSHNQTTARWSVVMVKLEMQHSPALARTRTPGPPLGGSPSCATTTNLNTTTSFLTALAWSGLVLESCKTIKKNNHNDVLLVSTGRAWSGRVLECCGRLPHELQHQTVSMKARQKIGLPQPAVAGLLEWQG